MYYAYHMIYAYHKTTYNIRNSKEKCYETAVTSFPSEGPSTFRPVWGQCSLILSLMERLPDVGSIMVKHAPLLTHTASSKPNGPGPLTKSMRHCTLDIKYEKYRYNINSCNSVRIGIKSKQQPFRHVPACDRRTDRIPSESVYAGAWW